jgi:hypothetical protein
MIKRQSWAVAYGGGEYGSEDSSDSELDEEDKTSIPSQAVSLSWAESVAQAEQIDSDDEGDLNEYANMALRGPMQVRFVAAGPCLVVRLLALGDLADLAAVHAPDGCDWRVPRPLVRAQAGRAEQRGRKRRRFLFRRRGTETPRERKQEGKAG